MKINHLRQEKMLIGGEWISGKEKFKIISPITLKPVAEVPSADKEQVNKAVYEALMAKAVMSSLPAYKRGEILKKTGEMLRKRSKEFAELITNESGKSISDSKSEVNAAIERLEFGAEEAHRLHGKAINGDALSSSVGKIAMTIWQPLGIVVGITPFNYPLYIPIAKIAPAIAAGNSIIIKPASADPTPCLRLAQLFEEAGLPKGGLQILTGNGGQIGEELIGNSKINLISFTGNFETGKKIAEKAVFAKLHLELGGKSPALVFPPCDIDLAVKECVKGALKYSGQRCDAVSRILVAENLYEEFLNKILLEVQNWKIGDPFKEDTKIGPLIDEKAVQKVNELVNDALYYGAKAIIGGGVIKDLFYAPTVLSEVNLKMRIAWEETFGPVITLIKVKDFEEAIKIANQSEYALDASIFTCDIKLALEAATKIQAGTVQINGAPAHGVGNFPYGGDENSGMGREGLFLSAEEMSKLHTVVFNLK